MAIDSIPLITSKPGEVGFENQLLATLNAIAAQVPNMNSVLVGAVGDGSGDMLASIYDTNATGIVDNAEQVNGKSILSDVPADLQSTLDSLEILEGNIAKTDVVQTFTKAQRFEKVDYLINDSITSVTLDMSLANNFKVLLDGVNPNGTLNNPTNIVAGQSGVIVINQGSLNPASLSFGSKFKFENDVSFTTTSGSGKFDMIYYHVVSGNTIACHFKQNFTVGSGK